MISKMMNRTVFNVRDRWKTIHFQKKKNQESTNSWSFQDILALLELIQKYSGIQLFKLKQKKELIKIYDYVIGNM